MGILYSRCIGVINAKGEYIMNLDHDDFLFDNDVLDTAYKSAKIGNFDIISFMYIKSKNYNCKFKDMRPREYNIQHNYIVTQPILSSYPLFHQTFFQLHIPKQLKLSSHCLLAVVHAEHHSFYFART